MGVTVYNDLIARHEYRDVIAGIENMETRVGRAGWVTNSILPKKPSTRFLRER